MKREYTFLSFLLILALCATLPIPAMADSSHARIVRLSLKQGDVRYTTEFHQDSMTDAKASWQMAPLNLPIRQGYAIGTDNNGRAAIEFENGAMAFLNANSVIEFYDLSLEDGAHITRLVLRQGTGEFYVHPGTGDYFSVTGGDFSVEANGRGSRFRVDNFDDGSSVSVQQGHVTVLRKKDTKNLAKGQLYAISLNDGGTTPVIASAGAGDDFDKWVSSRVDSVVTATTYANQYVNSANYTSGLADLYSYGSWYNLPGYGYGWQPLGMGMGWDPFSFGMWNYDPFFGGWGFLGSMPWGWLPYHYGGWVFSPVYGWLWTPTGFGYGGFMPYRPVTAVWMHTGTVTGLVPLHPLDAAGKTPLNVGHGIYPIQNNAVAQTMVSAEGQKWSTLKTPPKRALNSMTMTAAEHPTRVSRTITARASGGQPVVLSRNSGVVYDANQHRYVNNSTATRDSRPSVPSRNTMASRPSVPPASHPSYSASAHASSSGGSWSGGHSGGLTGSTSAPSMPSAPSGHAGGTASGSHH
jgi:uncharacterized protein DUF6600/FecR-like protein